VFFPAPHSQALAPPPRPVSPSWEADESTDTIVLDPDFARIAEAARFRIASHSSLSGDGSRYVEPDQGGGPEIVAVRIRWKPHPRQPTASTPTMDFQLKRVCFENYVALFTLTTIQHESFANLCEEIADEVEVLADNVVLLYDGARVFSSATPHSLKAWAEVDLGKSMVLRFHSHADNICVFTEACDKRTYQYLREHAQDPPPPPATASTAFGSQPTRADSDSETEIESAAEDDDTFKLVVRAGGTIKDVVLTVRPAAKCGAIVKAFLKRAGLADKYPEGKSRRKSEASGPRLVVDGERMNPDTPISEADLEDGDMVEIRFS
jgi:hypothetical protein